MHSTNCYGKQPNSDSYQKIHSMLVNFKRI